MLYKYNVVKMNMPQYFYFLNPSCFSSPFLVPTSLHITFLWEHRWNGTLEVFLRVVNLHSLTLWPKCVAVHKRAWQRCRLKKTHTQAHRQSA